MFPSRDKWQYLETGSDVEHKEIIRVFGVIGTRCLTVDRCLLVYAIVSVEETEVLDIKVVTVVCLKKLFKAIFGEIVFINYYLLSVDCQVYLTVAKIFGFSVKE